LGSHVLRVSASTAAPVVASIAAREPCTMASALMRKISRVTGGGRLRPASPRHWCRATRAAAAAACVTWLFAGAGMILLAETSLLSCVASVEISNAPMSAWPKLDPICRKVLLVPDASPACCTETADNVMLASCEKARPKPKPRHDEPGINVAWCGVTASRGLRSKCAHHRARQPGLDQQRDGTLAFRPANPETGRGHQNRQRNGKNARPMEWRPCPATLEKHWQPQNINNQTARSPTPSGVCQP